MKTFKLPKKGISNLSNDELVSLKEWGEHPGFQIALKVAKEMVEIYLQDNLAQAESNTDFNKVGQMMWGLAQFKAGLVSFVDAGNRAKEELDDRANI